jgi:hypothetical protein
MSYLYVKWNSFGLSFNQPLGPHGARAMVCRVVLNPETAYA